jgi:hypothetical protein
MLRISIIFMSFSDHIHHPAHIYNMRTQQRSFFEADELDYRGHHVIDDNFEWKHNNRSL